MSIKNDTFTEGSITSLESHVSDSGGGWSGAQTTSLSVDTVGKLYAEGSGQFLAKYTELPSSKDYRNTAGGKTGGALSTDSFGVACRIYDPADYYFIGLIRGDGTWEIVIKETGLTVLNSGIISGFNASTYYHLRLDAIGSELSLYINSVLQGTATDGISSVGAKRAGVWLENTNARIDYNESDYFSYASPSASLSQKKHLGNFTLSGRMM